MKLKIAYICICHTDPLFIARTARALKYESDGFFIHVDNKCDIAPFISACNGISGVFFINERINNYWGGFNSIIATMETIKYALTVDSYDRFVLLQGQDYPLYSPSEIHQFFEQNRDVEFCKAKNISCSSDKRDYMKCCGLWLFDIRPIFFLRIFRYFVHKFNKFGIKYRKSKFKTKNETWDIYHGWAQFCLTRDCVNYILSVFETNLKFNKFMKYRFPPDEIYIHTIIYNSHFKNNISRDIIIRRSGEKTLLNLTYFEYPNLVTIFKDKKDYYWLKETGCLFVRKVNSSSTQLLDEIDKDLYR